MNPLTLRMLAAAAALAAAAFGGWTANGWRLGRAAADKAATQAQQVAERAQEDQRLSARMSTKIQEASHVQAQEQVKNARADAAARVDAERVRGTIAAALGAGLQDSLAACQHRAATAGELLEDGLRVQAALAAGAESHAADVRALRADSAAVRIAP
jgi:hypothetical protein